MKVSEIFEVGYGTSFALNHLKKAQNGINFVSRTGRNNGVSAIVEPLVEVEPLLAGYITVAVSGSVLESFVQTKPFYTGFHILVLKPKKDMSLNEKLFYCMCIRSNKYKYSYGRQANKTLKDIELPNSFPNWVKSSKLIKFENTKKPVHRKKVLLQERKWKWFNYEKVFIIKKGYYNKKPPNSHKKEVPFIGATEKNNGITSYCSIEDIKNYNRTGKKEMNSEERIFKSPAITVSNNGSVGYAFYQEKDFTCSHDINPLYLKDQKLNSYLGLFLCTLIGLERYRWNYGRKWRPLRMPFSMIKLPVDKDGNPDWKFMENFIKALPYSSNIKVSIPSSFLQKP